MLKTTRRFFSTLALRYCDLMSAGWLQLALVASPYQAFSGCSASGWRSQKARRVDTAITRMGCSVVPFWDYRNPTLTQPWVFTMQNGHLVQVGTLKNNALLTDVIYGRGFGSRFRHQVTKSQPLSVGIFLPGTPHDSRMCWRRHAQNWWKSPGRPGDGN